LRNESEGSEFAPTSLDRDPLDRSTDRAPAALGLLEDAAPLFAPAQNLPMAGALLAIPSLVASGVLPIARKLYGSIAPAFYGLRTTLVAYILLALLRIPRPENLKEHVPGELGRIIGLDRILEVKTLRRKLTVLASRKIGQNFGRELARKRITPKRNRSIARPSDADGWICTNTLCEQSNRRFQRPITCVIPTCSASVNSASRCLPS
jgi:hypothetical protein